MTCAAPSSSDGMLDSSLCTGVQANYLNGSIRNAGLDPDNFPQSDPTKMNFGAAAAKACKDIWSAAGGFLW